MSASAAAYARQLAQLLPRGAVWALDAASNTARLLLGVAEELARADARGDALFDEWDPRTTYELLPDWERVLALPDPCVEGVQSVAARRASAAAKLIATGGQSPAYFIAVAAALGFEIRITEFTPHTVESSVDEPMTGAEWVHAWQVTARLGEYGELTVESGVDEAFSRWGSFTLECALGRLKPAQTTLIFAYE